MVKIDLTHNVLGKPFSEYITLTTDNQGNEPTTEQHKNIGDALEFALSRITYHNVKEVHVRQVTYRSVYTFKKEEIK